MKITQENVQGLTARLSVEMLAADYQDNVKKVLRDYQTKANIPGFRPGKVPPGMIQKMYGKAIKAEEVNKVLSDALYQYIDEQKLKALGNPLPISEVNDNIDFDTQNDFTFCFEIGLAPEISVDLSKAKIAHYQLQATDKVIDESIENIRQRFAQEDGKPAEINQDLFNKVYGPDAVNSVKEMRDRIRKEAETMYQREADRKFHNDAVEVLVEATDMELPDDFLKRWLFFSNREKNITQEQINAEYDSYRKMLKWQLIETHLLDTNAIKVEREDVKTYYVERVISQYFPGQHDDEAKNRFEQLAESMMQNQDEVKQVYEMIITEKLDSILMEQMKVKKETLDFDQFIALVKGTNEDPKTAKKSKTKKSQEQELALDVETIEETPVDAPKAKSTRKSSKKIED